MEPITTTHYWLEVVAVAKAAVKDAEGDRETAMDNAQETVDGHAWIIYTFHNMQVLTHTRNENAFFENNGQSEWADFSTAMCQMAFAAMLADVQAAVEIALDEYEP